MQFLNKPRCVLLNCIHRQHCAYLIPRTTPTWIFEKTLRLIKFPYSSYRAMWVISVIFYTKPLFPRMKETFLRAEKGNERREGRERERERLLSNGLGTLQT